MKMKKLFILITFMLAFFVSNSQISPWDTPEYWAGSFSAMSIQTTTGRIVIKDSIRNVDYPIKPGDWVGVFCVDLDGSLKCAGSNQYVNVNENLGLTLVADNPSTPFHKEGFYEDEEIIIIIYRWGIYQDVIADTLSFTSCNDPLIDCDGHFNNGSLYALDTIVADLPLEEHILYLNNMWSYISSYLKQINTDIEYMFEPVVDNMVILMTLSSQLYWPDQGINTIVNWRFEKAYQLKMNEEDTLYLYGIENDNINLTYSMGWYLVPVPYNNNYNVEDVFSTLYIQQTGIVKSNSLIYWPFYGINTLQYLEPGKGYQVHFDIETTANFELLDNKNIFYKRDNNFQEYRNPWTYTKTAISNTILLKNINNLFEYGNYIGVFDSVDNCCGYSFYDGSRNLVITAYGDDISTEDVKDGLLISEKFNFKLFNGTINDIEPIMTNNLFYVNDITYGYFNINKIKINDTISVKSIEIEIENNLINKLAIYSINGKLIYDNEFSNKITIEDINIILNKMNSPSGIYVYKLNNNVDKIFKY